MAARHFCSAGADDLSERAIIRANRQISIGVLCGLAAAAIWGGGAVVSRHLVTTSLDPADLVLLRYLGCFPVALILILAFRDIRLNIGWFRLAVLILLGGPLYQTLLIAGYQLATAGGGALLLSGLLPVFALALEYLQSKSVSRTCLLGAAAVLAGLALFSSGAGISGVSLGALLVFAVAAAAWAVLNACVSYWRVDPIKLAVALALFAPIFLPAYLLGSPRSGVSAPESEMALQIAYHGWLVAICATAFSFASVRLAGAHIAAVLQVMSPVFSVCFGAAFLGEAVVPAQGVGLMLVTGGMLLTLSAPSREMSAGGNGLTSRAILPGLATRTKQSRW